MAKVTPKLPNFENHFDKVPHYGILTSFCNLSESFFLSSASFWKRIVFKHVDDVVLCRWERQGEPVGMWPDKYEWHGDRSAGDCSLLIMDAEMEFDDGIWQCSVTPSKFKVKISFSSNIVVINTELPALLTS